MVKFIAGAVLTSMFWIGCGSMYIRYYTMSKVDYSQGQLIADRPENDAAFSTCEPTAANQNPCVVMFTDEFLNLKQDYYATKQQLEDCQRECRK